MNRAGQRTGSSGKQQQRVCALLKEMMLMAGKVHGELP
jgi:hypothetical protein